MSGIPPETGTPVPPAPIPWEQPGTPFGKGLIETIQLFFTRPHEGFQRMPTTPEIVRPLVYYLLLGWLATAAGQIWKLLLPMPDMFAQKMSEMGLGGGAGAGVFGTLVVIVIAPILLLIGLFIWSCLVHLFLMMLGGATAGFLTTIRVLCYAGTANLIGIVPVCGGIVGFVWALALEVIGLSIAHRTSYGKAAAAVLLPLVICCACVAVGVAFMGASIMSMMKR